MNRAAHSPSSTPSGPEFASPAGTTLDELVRLREAAQALRRPRHRQNRSAVSGGSVSRRLGRGLDFAEVRDYQPGDDVRQIDWKVTARTGHAHTKLFIEERERPVLLLIDDRASMRFATRGMYKSVMAGRLAALLGWCAVASGDRVGGFVLTDQWHREVRPQGGRRGLMSLLRAIDQAQKQGPGDDPDQLCQTLHRLRRSVQHGSTVILLSDFEPFDEALRHELGGLAQSTELLAIQIVDLLECELPAAGQYPIVVRAGHSLQRRMIDTRGQVQQERYRQHFQARQAELSHFLGRYGHRHWLAHTHTPLTGLASLILQRVAPGGQASRSGTGHAVREGVAS